MRKFDTDLTGVGGEIDRNPYRGRSKVKAQTSGQRYAPFDLAGGPIRLMGDWRGRLLVSRGAGPSRATGVRIWLIFRQLFKNCLDKNVQNIIK